MPTFDTPKPISATIDLGLGDVRITAGDRATTVVDVRPSDPSNDEDTRAASATRIEFANDQLLIKAPKLRRGCPAATAARSTSPSSCPPARTSAAARDPRTSAATAGSARAGSRSASARSRSSRRTACTSRAAPATSPSTTRSAPPSSRPDPESVRVRELDGGAVIKNSNGDTWVGVAARRGAPQRRQRQHRRRRRQRERRRQDRQRRRPAGRGRPRLRRARDLTRATSRSASARAPPPGST